MRISGAVVAALALTVACHREVRTEPPRDVEVFAGVPVDLAPEAGEKEYDWRLGDDPAAASRGPRFTRAFPTAGSYEVKALLRGKVAATFRVAVSPRPVLHAIPATAEWVVYLPKASDLQPLARFFNRAFGSVIAQSEVEHDPFLRYALSTLEGASPADLGMDAQEGVAVFRQPSGDVFAALGVADEPRALDAARRLFVDRGFHPASAAPEVLVLERQTERTIGFLDRGYLYLVPGYIDDGEPHARLEELREQVRAIDPKGLSAGPELASLRAQVPEGTAHLYFQRPPDGSRPRRIRGGLVALRLDGGRLEVEGRLRADAPLWGSDRVPSGVPLESAAEGPVLAVSASAPPEDLAQLLREGAASEQELALASKVFEGDFALTLYFDPRATLKGMNAGPNVAALAGTLVAHAGIRDRADAERLIEAALVRNDTAFKKRRAKDATVFLLSVSKRPVTIEVTRRRVSIEAGHPLRGRKGTPLARNLGAMLEGAFAPGHVSVLIDVGQVARELDPKAIAGSGSPALVAFLAAFVRQATAIDVLVADLAPERDGARLRASVTLRPE